MSDDEHVDLSHLGPEFEATCILEGVKFYAEQESKRYDLHLQLAKDYGAMALRSLFVLNGGAILATLTFLGATTAHTYAYEPADFVPAFASFATGLTLTIAAIVMAYFNFSLFTVVHADNAALANNIMRLRKNWPGNFDSKSVRWIPWTAWLSVGLGIAAALAFLAGCTFMGIEFSQPLDRETTSSAISTALPGLLA